MSKSKTKEAVCNNKRKYAQLNIQQADNGFFVVDYAADYKEDKHMVFKSKQELADFLIKRFK